MLKLHALTLGQRLPAACFVVVGLCAVRSVWTHKVYAASSLPHTPLSRYIESRVRQRLAKLEDDAAAATLSIRLISNVEVRKRECVGCDVRYLIRVTFVGVVLLL